MDCVLSCAFAYNAHNLDLRNGLDPLLFSLNFEHLPRWSVVLESPFLLLKIKRVYLFFYVHQIILTFPSLLSFGGPFVSLQPTKTEVLLLLLLLLLFCNSFHWFKSYETHLSYPRQIFQYKHWWLCFIKNKSWITCFILPLTHINSHITESRV